MLIGVTEKNAADFVEYCYNIILMETRALLFTQGYKCVGKGSRIAEISFLKTQGVPEEDILFLDELREFRNGILYYGQEIDAAYAKKVIRQVKKLKGILF